MARLAFALALALLSSGCALVEPDHPPPGKNAWDPDQSGLDRFLFGTRWVFVEGPPRPTVPANEEQPPLPR